MLVDKDFPVKVACPWVFFSINWFGMNPSMHPSVYPFIFVPLFLHRVTGRLLPTKTKVLDRVPTISRAQMHPHNNLEMLFNLQHTS